MNNIEIKLAEGMPVIKRATRLTLSSRVVTLLDDVQEPDYIPVPVEVQKELPFLGFKGLSDFVFNETYVV